MSYMAKAWDEDFKGFENLKKEILEEKKLSPEQQEELAEQERRIGALWRSTPHAEFDANVERIVGPLSWARVAVEFITPFIAACTSLFLLYRTSP
jgi:hypothetical protein